MDNMMSLKFKKIIAIFVANIAIIQKTFADVAPPDWDFGLPFERSKNNPHSFLSKWIAETVKYVWLLAIFSLTVWWIMYITSFWDDGKTKKARNLIVYSIIWVVVAWMAFALVSLVNSIWI